MTERGHTITPDTHATASVDVHGFAAYKEQNPDVASPVDWSGWIRFPGIEIHFAGAGPAYPFYNANPALEEVPEPSTWALLSAGLMAGLLGRRRDSGRVARTI